jgi:L-amino acid N-acyltransferase YncA
MISKVDISVKANMMSELVVEPMRPADWEQVSAIYLEGVATGHATFETGAPSWEQWDAMHLTFARLVARADGAVVGWAALSPVSQRCVYGGVAEVSVYVSGARRQSGVGRKLLNALIDESEASGIWTLQAGMFPENYWNDAAKSLELINHDQKELQRRYSFQGPGRSHAAAAD